MTKEEIYLEHKKQNLINLVNAYNNRMKAVGQTFQFEIDSENLDIEKTFCTPEKCKGCGNCCHTCPCVFSPNDFLDINDYSYMENIFNTGIVCISPTPRGYLVVRPRGITDEKTVSSAQTSYNPCLLLGDNGCLLPPEYRPSSGLLFYPIHNSNHRIMYSYENIDDEYEKYQSLMWKYFSQYNNQIIPFEIVPNNNTGFAHHTEENAMNLAKKLAGY